MRRRIRLASPAVQLKNPFQERVPLAHKRRRSKLARRAAVPRSGSSATRITPLKDKRRSVQEVRPRASRRIRPSLASSEGWKLKPLKAIQRWTPPGPSPIARVRTRRPRMRSQIQRADRRRVFRESHKPARVARREIASRKSSWAKRVG